MKSPFRATVTLLVALALALAAAPQVARAEGSAGEASFSTMFASRYVWRGQTLSQGFVAQPTVGITIGGFGANLWSNIDLDSSETDDDGIAMTETDLTLSYTFPVGPVSLTGGVIHYDLGDVDTQEIYLSAGLATVLNPTLTLYYDIDLGDGGFAVLAVSQEIPAGPISLTAGGSLGFNINDTAMVADASKDFVGLYYGEISLATSIPIFKNVSIDPRIAYSTALGGDGKDAIEALSVDGKKAMFSGSIAITAAF